MKPDDFEQRLQRQPLRVVPEEWRAEILGTASSTAATQMSRSADRTTNWLSTLLWPHPRAWAGLAAVWMVILGLKLATVDEAHAVGKNSSVTPEVLAELQQQKLLFAELVGEVRRR